jgi:cytochrome c peroxidase
MSANLLQSVIFTVLLIIGFTVWMTFELTSNNKSELPATYIPDTDNRPITPIPENLALDPLKVKLGRILFHDKRLSKDNTIACSSCHDLNRAGQDGLAVAVGINRLTGTVNSPTVLNSGFAFRQFWDGRAPNLEIQVEGPIHNPIEMNSNWQEVIAKLNNDPQLVTPFSAIWKDGITPNNIQEAIAEFERSLITPNSPFDRYLKGDNSALTKIEIKGWNLFRDLGCISCHQGVSIGNNMYANLGVMGDYFGDRGRPIVKSDLGRYNVTGKDRDKHVFKVPSLRNIALTAPYFHDGSIDTLDEVVNTMARYQLGINLSKNQRDHLVAFLESLTGEFNIDVQ